MSIYLKQIFPRPDSPQILRFRELETSLGLNEHQQLEWNSTSEPACKIFSTEKGYLLYALQNGVRIDGDEILPGRARLLSSMQVISLNKLELTLLTTNPISEVAGRTLRNDMNSPVFSNFLLIVKLGFIQRSFPLPISKKMSIGSDPTADIPIRIRKIKARHGNLCTTYDQKGNLNFQATDLDGQLQVEPISKLKAKLHLPDAGLSFLLEANQKLQTIF